MNITYETLKEFKDYGVGLISPEMELIALKNFEHLKFLLKEIHIFEDIINDASKELDALYEEMNEHSEMCAEIDEHPEWHNYEIAEDGIRGDFNRAVIKRAYENGWCRIGTYYKYNKGKSLEVEGFNNIYNYKKLCFYIADMLKIEHNNISFRELDSNLKAIKI